MYFPLIYSVAVPLFLAFRQQQFFLMALANDVRSPFNRLRHFIFCVFFHGNDFNCVHGVLFPENINDVTSCNCLIISDVILRLLSSDQQSAIDYLWNFRCCKL